MDMKRRIKAMLKNARSRSLMLLSTALLIAALSLSASAKTTLTFMQWSLGETMDAWWADTLEAFERTHDDVEVVRVFETGFTDRLMAMIAGGTPPDVFLARLDTYPKLALQGQLMDITDRIEKDAQLQAVMLPQDEFRSAIDGRWYGLGFKYGFAHTYYNRNFFDEAGLPPMPVSGANPWSWDEFVDALRKLTRRGADGGFERWGVSTALGSWARTGPLLQTMGVDFVTSDGFDISSPTAVRAIESLRDLHSVGMVAPYASVGNSRRRLPNQQAAITIDLDTDPHGLHAGEGRSFEWYGLGALPAGEGADTSTTYMFGENITIHKDSPNPDLAYELLKFAAMRAWNIDGDVPFLYNGRSGAGLHPDEPALAEQFAFTHATMVPPFVGFELQAPAMQAVRHVVEGREATSYLHETQRIIDADFQQLREEILQGTE